MNFYSSLDQWRLESSLETTRTSAQLSRKSSGPRCLLAKLCRRTFVDGSIQWASAECTVEADGRDRTEAACLDSHGWAQRGRGESCDALDSRVQKGWRGCSSETDDTGTSLWCSVLHRFFFDCFFSRGALRGELSSQWIRTLILRF